MLDIQVKIPKMDRSDQGSTVFVSDAVNAVVAADIADDMVATEVSRVLIIYTGGTIGMKNTPSHGYVCMGIACISVKTFQFRNYCVDPRPRLPLPNSVFHDQIS